MESKENSRGANKGQAATIRSGLMVLGGILVILGFFYVGAGVMASRQWVKATGIKTVMKADHNTNGTIIYACGSLCSFVGICGIVTALLKRRRFRLAFMGLLALALAANIGFIVWSGVQASRTLRDTKDRLRTQVTTVYGSSGDSSQSELGNVTATLDHLQIITPCCGWSGNDEENLFTLSPWHKGINQDGKQQRTLPDSCCIKANGDCQSTKNVKEARHKGFVHKLDCLSTVGFSYKVAILVWIVLLAGGCFFQTAFLSWLVMELVHEIGSRSRAAGRRPGDQQ